jgi:hypothetical protein
VAFLSSIARSLPIKSKRGEKQEEEQEVPEKKAESYISQLCALV